MRTCVLLCAAAACGLAQGPGKPEFLVLRDEKAGIEATVAPSEGGELSGLKVRFQGRWIELLYRARDYSPAAGWRGKAPLLWPATGRNFAPGTPPDGGDEVVGSYDLDGQRLRMPIHGFARSQAWRVERRDAAVLTLVLADSPATRRYYPFGFRLRVEYRMAGGALQIAYTVSAAPENTAPMPFSIGNHITFRTPFIEGSDPAAMLFETPSETEYLKSREGLPTGQSRPRSLAKPVRLGDFDTNVAVSLGGYRSEPYMRLADPAGPALRITQKCDSAPAEPLIRFNVWGDARKGYFSPEPWVGLQNSFNLRQGLVKLAPGRDWHWTFEIRPEVTR